MRVRIHTLLLACAFCMTVGILGGRLSQSRDSPPTLSATHMHHVGDQASPPTNSPSAPLLTLIPPLADASKRDEGKTLPSPTLLETFRGLCKPEPNCQKTKSSLPLKEQFVSILHDVEKSRHSDSFKESLFLDIPNAALVSNFCMDYKAQPTFFHPTKMMMNSKGYVKMRNEGNSKPRLHHKVISVAGAAPRDVAFRSVISSHAAGESSTHAINSSSSSLSVLITPYCWELYGYHLILCLMAMFAQLKRQGFGDGDSNLLGFDVDFTFGMVKSAGVFPYLAGSPTNWSDYSREHLNLSSNARPTPYWPLWKIFADHPSQVHPVSDITNKCFDIGILGSVPSYEVTPDEGRLFRVWSLRRLQIPVWTSRSSGENRELVSLSLLSTATPLIACRRTRVTLIQRTQRYKITNLADVEAQIRQGFGDSMSLFETVFLENMTIASQMEHMANTDVLIGVHGNGLSWSYIMPPNGAIIELWPNVPYNANFKNFALRHGLFHAKVAAGANCKARCPTSYVIPQATFDSVKQHLQNTAC